MILETERLSLRPLTASDAELLFPLLSDPEVMAHWDIAEVDDPDLVRVIVEGQVAAADAGKAVHWTIHTLDSDTFLGACDLSDIDRWHKRAEIGFMLGRGAWGQGYALEAMRSVVGHAATMGLRRLSARTHLGNLRSDALLEKLGFEEEGLLRGHVLRDGEHRDCRLFGLLL
ncbi:MULTISPECIES: GNAT family N-acetyltransferase [unclassified Phenylobacterium]|uniref:GNAT family N-acetyltransferase n=1 Tax=unclassified Phenylobacterium TaxID=2640670 RepID=UPI0022B49911|nr:GNAT family N-acetyltransferase [Phenylobacterium sp. NIBR 498073]MBS0491954.1 GNAT family N-acetyltransferase [Pseudomonadota bacterium]WGU38572.1 GNAT family N-acetyltransferase [Phenylobacterium sp. NIBR 498073]